MYSICDFTRRGRVDCGAVYEEARGVGDIGRSKRRLEDLCKDILNMRRLGKNGDGDFLFETRVSFNGMDSIEGTKVYGEKVYQRIGFVVYVIKSLEGQPRRKTPT